jgi:hypothetical protein
VLSSGVSVCRSTLRSASPTCGSACRAAARQPQHPGKERRHPVSRGALFNRVQLDRPSGHEGPNNTIIGGAAHPPGYRDSSGERRSFDVGFT